MQLPWRTLSFWFWFLLGTGGIVYWCYDSILPTQFHFNQSVAEDSPEAQQRMADIRAQYAAREQSDPAYHAQMEHIREQFREAARNKPPEPPLPWFCNGVLQKSCTTFVHSSDQVQSQVMGSGVAAVMLSCSGSYC